MTNNIQNGTRSINEILPLDLHVDVLGYLNVQDTAIARSTQHLWMQLTPPVQEKSLNLSYSKVDDETLKGIIGAYKRRAGKIVSLNLSHCPSITDTGLKHIAEAHLPLAELNLSGCAISDRGIKYLADAGIPLSKLDLGHKYVSPNIKDRPITDRAIKYLADARIPLTSLNLSYSGITNAGLKHLRTFRLNELILTGCDTISDKGVKYLADARLPLTTLGLRTLCRSISQSKITDKAIKYLADAHIPLTSLDLCNSDITETGIKYLLAFPLKELNLDSCDGIDTSKSFQYLSHLPLRKLSLSEHSVKMNNEKLIHLSQLKQLTDLDLGDCSLESDHLKHLRHLPLKHLNLEQNPNLQDRGLAYLADLPLESLNLSRCRAITSQGLDLLVSNWHLKNLDLGDMHAVLSDHARNQNWLISAPSVHKSRFQHRMSWLSAAANEMLDSNVWHFDRPSAGSIMDRDLNNLVLDYL